MKMFKRLCAGLLAGMLMVSSAAAADVLQDDRPAVDSDGQYTVTFENAALINGNEYVLLIAKTAEVLPEAGKSPDTFKAPAIDATTLTYIDQTTAADGKVMFTDFIPKSVPNSVILLGGEFNGKTSPIIIGYIDAMGNLVTLPTIKTMGTLAENLTFTYVNADGEVTSGTEDISAANNNVYTGTVMVEDGAAVTISKPKHLSVTIENITSENMSEMPENVTLYAGDYNGDGVIDVQDYVLLANAYNSSNDDLNLIDVGEDVGYININDYVIFANGYQQRSSTYTLGE